jgi:hypothetical protein
MMTSLVSSIWRAWSTVSLASSHSQWYFSDKFGPVYMRPRWSQTGMKIEIVNMFNLIHETGTKITKFSIYSPCQGIFFFRWLLLACVVPMSRSQPRPVWNVFVFTFITVWIHAGLKSVGSVHRPLNVVNLHKYCSKNCYRKSEVRRSQISEL